MQNQNRRAFLQSSAGVVAVGLGSDSLPVGSAAFLRHETMILSSDQTAPVIASNAGKKPLRLGLIIALSLIHI